MSERLARRGLGAIDAASRRLTDAGIELSRLDAELLLAEAAGVSRESVIAGWVELSDEALRKFDAMIARRERREPVAYIVRHKEFYSLDFEVTPAVLIPRPETEFVVAETLEFIAGKDNARVLDIGTGSGAIAIAIAVNAPSAQITAVDISSDALAVASRNVLRHRVEDRVTFRQVDCFDVLDGGAALGFFHVIASNPPYLGNEEIVALDPDVRNFEPLAALSAGKDGLDVTRRIASEANQHLEADGQLIVEVGLHQASCVARLIEDAGLRLVSVINDLAGHQRVLRARKLAGQGTWKK